MQNIVFAASAASQYALMGVGFLILLRITRFLNFGYAAIFLIAGHVAFYLRIVQHLPLATSIIAALLLALGVALVFDRLVYVPIQSRFASPLPLLVASLGLYIATVGLLPIFFGAGVHLLHVPFLAGSTHFIGARVSGAQMLIIGVGSVICLSIALWIRCGSTGLIVRAVASDASLAVSQGIDISRVRMIATTIGSLVAGSAGILVVVDTGMSPGSGMSPLMTAAIVVAVGGRNGIKGVAIASCVLAAALGLVTWVWGAQWRDPVALGLLLLCLSVFRDRLTMEGDVGV